MNNKQLHSYKFALYGASGAGKTVFLAALAMDRIAYHPDFACTRIPLTESLKDGNNNGTVYDKWRRDALKEGNRWLDEAIDRLKHELMPLANPHDHPDMLFEFDLSSGNRTYRVEFIDYAGELVHSSQSANENASRLRGKLKEMDALLVLAPAPWPENDLIPLDKDLQSIRETFMLMLGERDEPEIDLPLALLLDKWDRRSELEYHTPENEHQELQEFFDQSPPPPHKTLLKALKSAVAGSNNFRAFPVSALGECKKIKQDDGNLIDGSPDRFNPLSSFGLEDPLIWAAERCDEIAINRLEFQIQEASQSIWGRWKPWPFSLLRLKQKSRELLYRFPNNCTDRATAKTISQELQGIFYRRLSILMFILISIILLAEMGMDGVCLKKNIHIVDNPKSSIQSVEGAVDWLQNYTEAPFFQHSLTRLTFLGTDGVEKKIKKILEAKEEQYWDDIFKTSDGVAQINKARQYINRYPSGRHVGEATSLINWLEFKRIYDDLMNQGKFLEAGQLLDEQSKLMSADGRFEEVKQNYWPRAINDLESKIKSLLGEHRFEEAEKCLREMSQSPPGLILEGGGKKIREIEYKVKVDKDRWLYQQAKEYENENALQSYLDNAPLGYMDKHIQKYLNWLGGLEGEHEMTLYLSSIQWGSDTSRGDPVVLRVFWDGRKIMERVDLESSPNTSSDVNAKYRFKGKLDEEVTLQAEAVDKDIIFDNPLGTGMRKVKIRNMKGLVLRIKTPEMTNSLHFQLFGLPKEPELPIWKE